MENVNHVQLGVHPAVAVQQHAQHVKVDITDMDHHVSHHVRLEQQVLMENANPVQLVVPLAAGAHQLAQHARVDTFFQETPAQNATQTVQNVVDHQ